MIGQSLIQKQGKVVRDVKIIHFTWLVARIASVIDIIWVYYKIKIKVQENFIQCRHKTQKNGYEERSDKIVVQTK